MQDPLSDSTPDLRERLHFSPLITADAAARLRPPSPIPSCTSSELLKSLRREDGEPEEHPRRSLTSDLWGEKVRPLF